MSLGYVHTYDRKSGDPVSYLYCASCDCYPVEVGRTYLGGCDHSWACKCPSLEIVYRCPGCGDERSARV